MKNIALKSSIAISGIKSIYEIDYPCGLLWYIVAVAVSSGQKSDHSLFLAKEESK